MSLIKAENLSKTFRIYNQGEGIRGYLKSFISRDYEEVHAVEDLNLEIDSGEMIGYIGSNGAGKSTTVKMLTGILEPSNGVIEVNGLDPHKKRKKNAMNIGVVFGQKTQLWWDLPVKESFKLLKEIYEVSDEDYDERIEEFDEVLQLSDFWDQPVRKLSLGQKMRCELAAAFLHHPKIVYLDEPTIGLDVAVKERIRDFIRKMNQQEDITVMLTTHDIDDIEDLCERIVVLDEGKKIYDGQLDSLVNRFSSRRLVLETDDDIELDIQGVKEVQRTNGQTEIVFDREVISAADLMKEVLDRYDVSDFQIKEPDIEAVVKKIYNEGLAE
ncbi:ABC transporter ATP-binding protein [Candidatus Nanohalococcus occultus]|uniref:ABC transporter ATP-binding protein n=1 Tax=Candidatus Nanohalococcus occultus TaxID=2978047 RepID=UPI0039E14676